MEPLSNAIELEFLALRLADVQAGRERSLDQYCALFPGHAELIEAAFHAARASDAHGARDSARLTPDSLGHYRLLREVGRGAQGAVWLALDPRLGRRVALKVVPRSPLFDSIAPRFEREARVASKLEHPGICGVLDCGADERCAWIAMRWIDGDTLAAQLAQRSPGEHAFGAQLDTRLALLERIARALHFAHEAGVVHRDIKPANVMVTPQGEPVILDFGIARADEEGLPLTLTGDAIGTPAYMAPEQLREGAARVDRRADVWSLGVTAFEALTGRRPFEAPTRDELVRRVLDADAPDAREFEPALPRDLATVLATALERDVQRRYPTAADFAEDLRRVREREPIRARPASAALKLRRWTQRNPKLAASLVALFAVLAVALGVTSTLLTRTREALSRRDMLVRDVARLSDQTLATELIERERSLWPARAENVAAMDGWLLRVDELCARRVQHERARDALAERTDLDEDPQRNANAREWFGAQLAKLFSSLDELQRLRPRVAQRRELATSIRRLTVDDCAAAWDSARAAVAADPRFHGFQLAPQVGLVPLGPDPRSKLEEFAHFESGLVPRRDPRTGELELSGASAIVLVLVPPGEFDLGCIAPDGAHPLGSPNVDPHAARWDGPLVHVALEPFFIGKHELTQGQWSCHVGSNPSLYQAPSRLVSESDPLRHPVDTVSWNEAERLLRELDLSLCSEARWEYAARAGTTSVYFTGDNAESLQGYANLADRFAREHDGGASWRFSDALDDGFVGHAPVGSFAPNAFGLHDVLGNIGEWCLDTWEDLAAVSPRPGDGFFAGVEVARVQRGGSYSGHPEDCRVAFRAGVPPALSAPAWGLRAARDVR